MESTRLLHTFAPHLVPRRYGEDAYAPWRPWYVDRQTLPLDARLVGAASESRTVYVRRDAAPGADDPDQGAVEDPALHDLEHPLPFPMFVAGDVWAFLTPKGLVGTVSVLSAVDDVAVLLSTAPAHPGGSKTSWGAWQSPGPMPSLLAMRHFLGQTGALRASWLLYRVVAGERLSWASPEREGAGR